MRSRLLSALSALALLAGLHLFAAPAASAHPYCGITWGSMPKAAGTLLSEGTLVNVRAGRHDCYDRLVLDVDAPLTGWSVRYVDEIRQDGSGFLLPVAGGARLQVIAGVPAIATDSWFVGPYRIVDTRAGATAPSATSSGPAASRASRRSGWACAPGCRSARSCCPVRVPARGSSSTSPTSGAPPGTPADRSPTGSFRGPRRRPPGRARPAGRARPDRCRPTRTRAR
ncbi:hypothetical protein [Cellulomonas sp. JZ18]|uniref:AMIN-like domain-containing (lipo)protein n=1 Tax=Cellulomonas sp. JZ18 TaxID=2654191 RepID=UPI00351B4B30